MSKIIINNTVKDGIPLNEYYSDSGIFKGLVFVQHGYQSNKNRGADYLAINIARLGFKVVSIDAFKHGDRIAEPYITQKDYKRYADVFNVITTTTQDIIRIHQKYYQTEFPRYDFIGVSMGGMIAYDLCIKTDLINKLIPVISTPMFLRLAKSVVDLDEKEKYNKIIINNKEYINSIDPINSVDLMSYQYLYILNTTNDNTVPGHFSEEFFNKHRTPKMYFKYYQDEHNVNIKMQQDILSFLAEEKVVL